MGKFKEFLINEEVGLADLGPNIEKLFNSQEFGNQVQGAFVSSQWNNTYTNTPWKGNDSLNNVKEPVDLQIPSISRTGKIVGFLEKNNPVYIKLSDGTECSFTNQEMKNIEGKPAIGKTMTVIFQRHPDDFTRQYSKIEKAIVVD
jgi:hypothetical protein